MGLHLNPISHLAHEAANVVRRVGSEFSHVLRDPAGSGEGGRSSGYLDAATDPGAEIGKLDSDGDRVVLSLTGEAKLQVPVPVFGVPLGVGGKGQYGYDIIVEQVGDEAGRDSPVAYEVTFDKTLLAGGVVEPPLPGVDPASELNFSSADSVTMSFTSKAEAERAVRILERIALAETVHDAGPGFNNPATNPVADNGNGPFSNPTLTEPLADRLQPSPADRAFLQEHIASYSTTLGVQERNKIAAKAFNLGLEPRLDANQQITRTVELPRGGEPGRLSYTLSGDLTPSTKEKLTVGVQEFDQLEIGYVPQNIVEHGTARAEISLSWELPDAAFDPRLGNRPVPEAAFFDADGLDAPDEITVRLQLDYQKPAIELSRTDMGRVTLEAVLDRPGARAIQAANALLGGDVKQAFAGLGEDLNVTVTHEDVERYGINQQHELGFEVADVFEGKLSLLAELGRDDIRNRRVVTFGPDAKEPAEAEPAEAEPARSDQRVVTPEDGVSIYGAPGREDPRIGVVRHGSFVDPTGRRETDPDGEAWIEVAGPDVDGRPVQGWVPERYTQPHEDGAMRGGARINPELERQGLETHVVAPGDTVWDLAQRDGIQFQQMLQLNNGHLINPGLIFPGDIVYIPGTGAPPAEPEPAAEPEPEQPKAEPPPAEGRSVDGSEDSGSQSGDRVSGEPAAPQGGPAERDAAGRPSLDIILRDYQVEDDPGGVVEWEPHGGLLDPIARRFIQPVRVTAREAELLDRLSLVELRDMQDIKARAFDTADALLPPVQNKRGDFPAGEAGDGKFQFWATNDGHNDAFRHAYWNALLTKRFGADFARQFATAHEGTADNPADREAMDLHNNEVGRHIAEAHPGASEDELAALVQDALERGELVVIDGSGNLAWSDQVAYGGHGAANDPAVPGGALVAEAQGTSSRLRQYGTA